MEYNYPGYHMTQFLDGTTRYTYTWKNITIKPDETIIFNILISLNSEEILRSLEFTDISIPSTISIRSKIFKKRFQFRISKFVFTYLSLFK